jgi:hypothetical protein
VNLNVALLFLLLAGGIGGTAAVQTVPPFRRSPPGPRPGCGVPRRWLIDLSRYHGCTPSDYRATQRALVGGLELESTPATVPEEDR